MKILLRRIYLRENFTVGCLQVILSGKYESEYIALSTLKPHLNGGLWTTLADTIEPRAIAWEDKPLIGQKREERIAGLTAIAEGTYRVTLRDSKTYKRKMPTLVGVPEFRNIVLRTGKNVRQTRGEILVGRLAPSAEGYPADNPLLEESRKIFNLLFNIIEEAMDYGEKVSIEVSSPKGWTYPS